MGCEKTHPGGLTLTRRQLEKVRRMGLWTKEGSVLDVGCGSGQTVRFLAGQGVVCTGIDIEKSWEDGILPDNPVFCQTSLFSYHPEKKYRMIMAECVLSLLDVQKALERIYALLEEDGVLLISDLFDIKSETLSKGRWERYFKQAGFCLLDWEEETSFFREYMARWVWEHGSFPWKGRKMSYFAAILSKEAKIRWN